MASKRWIGFAGFVLGLAFLSGGTLLAVFVGWPSLKTARVSSAWPSVEGEITASQVDEQIADDTRTFGARIAYAYAVDGESYSGSRIQFGGSYRSTAAQGAEATVAAYPVGEIVAVHYDPLDPANSVLKPGGSVESYAVLTLGIAIAAVGLVLMIPPITSAFSGGNPGGEATTIPAPQAGRRGSAAKSDSTAA